MAAFALGAVFTDPAAGAVVGNTTVLFLNLVVCLGLGGEPGT